MAIVKLPQSNPRMPFGKHRGIPVDELPDRYLSWLYEHILDSIQNPSIRDAVEKEYELRGLYTPNDQIGQNDRDEDDHDDDDEWGSAGTHSW